MATTEVETSKDERGPPRDAVYAGFISYSHAADDLLAPRLQAGLQRFAKPWWKRRAMRIFRDESSLSANPHLWSSITDALDSSDWFVLLLSPDAADSEWVNQEVEYWLEHKDPDRIIPVLTDGEFRWAETDIDLESDAVPPALYGAFSDEPRWVDLRFARAEEQLDLQDPRFADAVADVASAIRGVPKDDLASEEVRQHRRTVRTAWGAGAGLLVLALAAGGAALFALDQRNDALAAQAEAELQRDIAHARQLTFEAEDAVEFDPELGAHLALAALATLRTTGADTSDAVSVLRRAIASDRVTVRVPGANFVAIDPDGSLLATADVVDDEVVGVAVWDIASGEIIDRLSRTDALPFSAVFHPEGDQVAISFNGDESADLTLWDLTTGESTIIGPRGLAAVGEVVFSDDGAYIAFDGAEEVTSDDANDLVTDVFVWSVAGERGVARLPGRGVDFGPEGLLSFNALDDTGEGAVVILDPESGVVVDSIPTGDFVPTWWTEWSPDGTRITTSNQDVAAVFDVGTGTEGARTFVDRVFDPVWISNEAFVVGGESVPRVIDAATGEVRMDLPAQPGGTYDLEAVSGTGLVASAGSLASGTGVVIYDTSPEVASEIAAWSSALDTSLTAGYIGDGSRIFIEDGVSYATADARSGANALVVDGSDALSGFPGMDASGSFAYYGSHPDGTWVVRSLTTGDVIYEAPEGWAIKGVSDDGAQAVIGAARCRPHRLVSTSGAGPDFDLAVACMANAYFSPDSELVVASFAEPGVETAFFDTVTGELVAHLGEPVISGIPAVFTPDGGTVVIGSWDGSVFVIDVATLLSGAPVEEYIVREIAAHDTAVFRMAMSPDGTMFTTSPGGEPLRLWDLESGQLLGQFGAGSDAGSHLGDFHPTLDLLMVTTPPNHVRIYTLDLDELVAIAESRLSREMTEPECQQYFREPCPIP